MRKLLLLVLIGVLVVIPAAVAQPEDLPNSYTFEDTGYTIYFPEDWRDEVSEDDVVYLTNDDYIYDFDFYVSELQQERGYPEGDVAALSELLFYAADESITATFDDFVETTVNDETVYIYAFTDVNADGSEFFTVYYTRLMEDGTFFIGFLYPASGSDPIAEDMQELGAAIAANFAADSAGEVTEYVFDEDNIFYLPADWESQEYEDGVIYFTNGDYNIDFDFYTPDLVEEQELPADVIEAAASTFYPFDESIALPADVEVTTIDDVDWVIYDYTDNFEGESFQSIFAAAYLSDGTFILGSIYPTSDTTVPEDVQPLLIEVLASLRQE
jgi:hypothetical protein